MGPGRLDRLAVVLALSFVAISGAQDSAVDAMTPVSVPVHMQVAAPAPVAAGRPAEAGQVADPVRIRIPAIRVDALVGPLEVLPDGSLAAPARFDAAGWWRAGPEPGESGPAVVAGHIDNTRGPAVFYNLRRLRPGDEVLVDRADGTSAEFVVERLETYPKDRFPTDAVYGPTPGPELRLITCTGPFDRSARSYLDNIVVFARGVP